MEEAGNENRVESQEPEKEPEIDLLDGKGHKEKLEVYEEKEEPVRQEEIVHVARFWRCCHKQEVST